MESYILAIIAGVQVVTIILVQSWISARKEKRDYARQDAVAARVADAAVQADAAAALLLQAQRDTIARTDDVAARAAEADTRVQAQLKEIHVLVNSDMTAARTSERDSLKLLVLALRRIGPLGVDADEISKVEQRIGELNQILADRLAAQEQLDAAAQDRLDAQ